MQGREPGSCPGFWLWDDVRLPSARSKHLAQLVGSLAHASFAKNGRGANAAII